MIKANKVSGYDECKNPGDYYFSKENKSLIYMCPTGCGVIGVLPLEHFDGHAIWIWNLDENNPSLTPSIQKLDGCRWHGFLTNGEWITV
jgi:hypothetical protein